MVRRNRRPRRRSSPAAGRWHLAPGGLIRDAASFATYNADIVGARTSHSKFQRCGLVAGRKDCVPVCDCARALGLDWRPCVGGHGTTAAPRAGAPPGETHCPTARARPLAVGCGLCGDTNSGMLLRRDPHLPEAAVNARLGVRPTYLAGLMRLLAMVAYLTGERSVSHSFVGLPRKVVTVTLI